MEMSLPVLKIQVSRAWDLNTQHLAFRATALTNCATAEKWLKYMYTNDWTFEYDFQIHDIYFLEM